MSVCLLTLSRAAGKIRLLRMCKVAKPTDANEVWEQAPLRTVEGRAPPARRALCRGQSRRNHQMAGGCSGGPVSPTERAPKPGAARAPPKGPEPPRVPARARALHVVGVHRVDAALARHQALRGGVGAGVHAVEGQLGLGGVHAAKVAGGAGVAVVAIAAIAGLCGAALCVG